MIPSWL